MWDDERFGVAGVDGFANAVVVDLGLMVALAEHDAIDYYVADYGVVGVCDDDAVVVDDAGYDDYDVGCDLVDAGSDEDHADV